MNLDLIRISFNINRDFAVNQLQSDRALSQSYQSLPYVDNCTYTTRGTCLVSVGVASAGSNACMPSGLRYNPCLLLL
jgi:hypothetical protein